ncbi:hypothetical protein AAIA72_12635 [Hahella sp. SMD15-11]|uniref:SPOR domain-containing protein n=1 Tax=Thermohahella caldifontis TaxID=3142973 RepID=A0AB39UTN4_9GAMM
MYQVKAISKKGTQFRFRVRTGSIQELQNMLDAIFRGRGMRMVLVQPV